MERFEDNLDQSPASIEEGEGAENDKQPERKPGFLDRIKKFGQVAAFTAMTAGTQEASAQDVPEASKDNAPKKEQVEQKEVVINESLVTSSGSWAREYLKEMKEWLSGVKTAEDAENILALQFRKFVGEYYIPKKGIIKDGAYGTKSREYSEDDHKVIFNCEQSYREILESLNKKFPDLPSYKMIDEELADMKMRLENEMSISGKADREILKRWEEGQKKKGQ